MASRSRLLWCLAVAALLIVALLWTCRSRSPQPFRYAGGQPAPPAPPGLVEIIARGPKDCRVNPELAVIEVGLLTLGQSRGQALWHVIGKQAGDKVVIAGERAEIRNPRRRNRGVENPFPRKYEIPPSYDAIRSGSLKAALKLFRDEQDALVWTYSIDYYRDGKLLCWAHSPTLCIQKMGSGGGSGCQSGG
jgi:hypothetical protein